MTRQRFEPGKCPSAKEETEEQPYQPRIACAFLRAGEHHHWQLVCVDDQEEQHLHQPRAASGDLRSASSGHLAHGLILVLPLGGEALLVVGDWQPHTLGWRELPPTGKEDGRDHVVEVRPTLG